MTHDSTAQQKNETLFGGRDAIALHEDGSKTAIRIRQIPLGQYPKAYSLLEDEFALTAFCCCPTGPAGVGEPFSKDWVLTLLPECYEELQAAAREVNERGFFAYARRQKEREQEAMKVELTALSALDPEMLKAAAAVGADGRSTSAMPSPRPRPR